MIGNVVSALEFTRAGVVGSGAATYTSSGSPSTRCAYELIIGVNSASLSDLRKGPAILVGGPNNPWTLRILRPLRVSITSASDDAASPQILQIADRKNHCGSPWTVDFRQPISTITHDYAIITRFQASMTDGEVIGGRRTRLGGHGERQQVYQVPGVYEATSEPGTTQLAHHELGSHAGN
jgi:hypothetical protein